MSSNTSVIDNPQFLKCVKSFDANDPEILKAVEKRNQASKAYFSGLERQVKRIERKTNLHIPVRNIERS